MWCERRQCAVLRVYQARGGRLIEYNFATRYGSDSAGDIRDGVHAEWVEELADDEIDLAFSFSCNCDRRERHWAASYADILTALQDGTANIVVGIDNELS